MIKINNIISYESISYYQVMLYDKSIPNEDIRIMQNIFKWSHCKDVAYSKKIFKEEFVDQLYGKVLNHNKSEDLIPLSKINFEDDWFAIFNFYVYPTLCELFTGLINPQLNSIDGRFYIFKQDPFNHHIYKNTTMDFNHELTAILTLNTLQEDNDEEGIIFYE